jgi:hypothetical protein
VAAKKKRTGRTLSPLAGRDIRVQRAVEIAGIFVATQPPGPGFIYSGGGTHVGPPHGRHGVPAHRKSREASDCNFSFQLPISPDDVVLLTHVFELVLGGKFCKWDDDGNEDWDHPLR